MGEGDDKLGKMLMKGFVYALTQLEELPQTILLFNSGASLSCEDVYKRQALIYSVWKSGKVPYLGLFLYLAEVDLLQVVAKHVANSHQFCGENCGSFMCLIF